MNRAFLVIIIPAVLVITAYFLLAAYAGVQLTYARAWRAGWIRNRNLSGECVRPPA